MIVEPDPSECLYLWSQQLEMFAKFVKTYPDRENGIQTISNAMTASRYSLAVFFDVRELTNIGRPIFTGFLKLGPFFMCRSLALSKKAAKVRLHGTDCLLSGPLLVCSLLCLPFYPWLFCVGVPLMICLILQPFGQL